MAGEYLNLGGVITHISYADADGSAVVNGRTWRWEFHDWVGPSFLRKDGEMRKCQNPNKAVWKAFYKWHKQYEKNKKKTETMSIEIENKLDRIIQLLEELLQERHNPSHPTQGEDTEWHNPENVSIEQLGQGYRFLKPWEVDGRHRGIAQLWAFTKWAGACGVSAGSHSDTYRVPITTPIPPKP